MCLQPKISKTQQSWTFPVFNYVSEHVSGVTLREKNWIISVTAVRNKQCLQRGGRSLSSSHENRASLCQQLF